MGVGLLLAALLLSMKVGKSLKVTRNGSESKPGKFRTQPRSQRGMTPDLASATKSTRRHSPRSSSGIVELDDGGYLLRDAPLNDVIELLTTKAEMDYIHNPQLIGSEFFVNGHLHEGNPLKHLELLSFQYGQRVYQKGNAIYVMTDQQLDLLPAEEWRHEFRHLRPTDVNKHFEELIQPFLSDKGIWRFDPKTNAFIITDNPIRNGKIREFLSKIDRPQTEIPAVSQ